MLDLTKAVQAVYAATDITTKRELVTAVIEGSHAKNATKAKHLRAVPTLTAVKLDALATNYMLAGEGLAVL